MQAVCTLADFVILMFCISIWFAELSWQRGENDIPANLSVYLVTLAKTKQATTALRNRGHGSTLALPTGSGRGYGALRWDTEGPSDGCGD